MTEQNTAAISELQQQATTGNAKAQFELALCYKNGKGVDKSQALALEWSEKSAEQGYVEAQFALGLYYFLGVDNTQTGKLMSKHFARFVNKNMTSALELSFNLAMIDSFQKGNAKLSFKWFKQAAEQNHAESCYWLGMCYQNGWGTESNVEIAFSNFKQSAELNYADAYSVIAHCYRDATGTEKNHNRAFHWITKAVEKSDIDPEDYLFIGDLYSNGYGVPKNDNLAFKWYEKVANMAEDSGAYRKVHVQGLVNTEFQFRMANYYLYGKGVEQNDARAFEYFERSYHAYTYSENAADRLYLPDVDLLYPATELYMAICYALGKGVKKDLGKASIFCISDELRQAVVEGPSVINKSEHVMSFYILIGIELFKLTKEYGLAREFINNAFEGMGGPEKTFQDICLGILEQEEKLDKKNQELEVKNQELEKTQKELEDMMSMFAHKFRSPLDAIIYNTSHENSQKLYIEAAQSMRGLLDIFSIISTDDKILTQKIIADSQGNSTLLDLFSNNLNMILLHFLSVSSTEKIRQHYINYAKTHKLCDACLSLKEWNEEYFELEQSLQSEWEQSYSSLLAQSASLEQRLQWLEEHFFKLELQGFSANPIKFQKYATTESFLTIILNEILVNAFKYYASDSKQVVTLKWENLVEYQILSCNNPSTRFSRSRIKGSSKGHTFLSALAHKTGCEFNKPELQDNFIVEFTIPNQLLIT